MGDSFVADVRLDDSDEVLQLPIVKARVKKMMGQVVKKMGLSASPQIPSSDDPLEIFLTTTGKFFGKDPSDWHQMGEPQLEITEEGGKRHIKSTGIFSGLELHMFYEPLFFDERMTHAEDKPEDMDFSQKRRAVLTDDQWHEIMRDQPWTMSKRRLLLTAFLQAKMESGDIDLMVEGCHGLWEMSINKINHNDIKIDRMASLVDQLHSQSIECATIAAAAVWGLATSSGCRKMMSDLDVITMIIGNIKRSLKATVIPDPPPNSKPSSEEPPSGTMTESQRSTMQKHLLGALAMLLVDRCCRRPYIHMEPEFNTLFSLCRNIDGYKPAASKYRRETAAKVLTSLCQRDQEARKSLISSGSLKHVLDLLGPQYAPTIMIQFCMASLLATLVLDDEVMELVRVRGEAPIFFEACLTLLKCTMTNIFEELERQDSGFYDEEGAPEEDLYDVELGIRLSEASAQALWGSSYICVGMDPPRMKMEHVEDLASLALDCYERGVADDVPLSRVCHCLVACMATLSSTEETAELMMDCPGDMALATMMTLSEVEVSDVFERAGHVKASACAGVAFLACHPIGAEGDACMNGPHRTKVLEQGAFGTLLRAALKSVEDEACDMIVQQAAAIGLMFLASMAGTIAAAELSMYAALLMDSGNSEMIEFLMAGMWILLRNPENRKVLGSAFSTNPGASSLGGGLVSKLNDAVVLHDINDQAQELAKTAMTIQAGSKFKRALSTSKSGGLPDSAASPRQQHSVGSEGSASTLPPPSHAAETADAAAQRTLSIDPNAVDHEPGGGSPSSDHQSGGSPRRNLRSSGSKGRHYRRKQLDEDRIARSRANSDADGLMNDLEAFRADDDEVEAMEAELMVAGGDVKSSASKLPPAASRAQSTASIVGGGRAKSISKAKDEGLVKKFDKELKENWGLETLVAVGESWLPEMLKQDAAGEASDVPVLKLFEFLVASICLFMIEEESKEEQRGLDLYRLDAPPGVRSKSWWTVEAKAPEPESFLSNNHERALKILVKIVGLHLGAAWKSIQLGILTIWNVCSRNASMERHVVERGLCGSLLDVTNRIQWPASVRDMAGGCLEFFAERGSSMAYGFPRVPLPPDINWPYKRPPMDGLVPTLAGYINLVNSRDPLLEYRGCHGLARITYAAPYGSEDPKGFVKDAKAVATVLGGVDALIDLMKRVNRRYQDLVLNSEKKASKKQSSRFQADQADAAIAEAALFEKDMNSLEAQQDIYFCLLAALLNISVLKSVQPIIAKKGLMVLLGTNTIFYGRVSGGEGFVVPPSEAEDKLLHLCSSILQNLSLHPQNRTMIYKAELAGTSIMDKLIEDATESSQNDATLKEVASILPPIHSPSSPHGQSSPKVKNKSHGIMHHVQHNQSNSPGSPKTLLAPKSLRMSPNGAVLNTSVDTAIASTLRPKVAFPPIASKEATKAATGHAASLHRGGDYPVIDDQAEVAENRNESKNEESTGGAQDASYQKRLDSRYRFLNWMDNTFQGGEGDQTSSRGAPNFEHHTKNADGSEKKSSRRQMFDENGDWIEGHEVESSKALHKLLCRPVTHLWLDSPEARARQGKARWMPSVSEYQEAGPAGILNKSAARLLSTEAPRDGPELLHAAGSLMATGKFSTSMEMTLGAEIGATATLRPDTQQRARGQVPLTVLKAGGAADSLGATAYGQASAMAAVASGADPAPFSMGSLFSKDEEEADSRSFNPSATKANPLVKTASADGGSKSAVALKVCLGPKRTRQMFVFKDDVSFGDDPHRPMLTVFERVEGSRVCEGLFPAYHLPNGKQAYMYYDGGMLLDECHVDAVSPPPRPSTVPQALQQTMPLADVLNLIAKPPGSAPPFIPYKPVPHLVPLPSKHTLKVKRPDDFTSASFGDLREDNLQLVLYAKKIIKNQVSTRVESIEVKIEHKDPWKLEMSIFKPRVKEADSHDFYDRQESEDRMFERDWQRACAKEKFTGMLCRENKSNKSNPMEDKAMIEEVHNILLQHYRSWYGAFMYYAASGSGDPYHMSLNAWTTFLDDCQIADPESQFIKRSDCDTIFIVCNFQPDKKSAEAQVNVENAMMRYEFLEALVRSALAKYGKGQATDDVVQAVKMLMEKNIVPNLPAGGALITNDFRQNRLYNEDVDLLLKKHSVLLKAMWSRYRLKPIGGGLRTKVVRMEGWLQLMNDAHLIDGQFTLQDSTLAYLWSRMQTVDEIKDYQKMISITFIDFLEALGRVADMKSLPTNQDLEHAGYSNILDWDIDKERVEGSIVESKPKEADSTSAAAAEAASEAQPGVEGGRASPSPHNFDRSSKPTGFVVPEVFKTRDSAGFQTIKHRPLYAKLELLLDLIFRRLFYDPGQPELQFSYEGLLRLIKKIDKDMGP